MFQGKNNTFNKYDLKEIKTQNLNILASNIQNFQSKNILNIINGYIRKEMDNKNNMQIEKIEHYFIANNKGKEEKNDNELIGRKTKRDCERVNKIEIIIEPKNIPGLDKEELFNFDDIDISYQNSRNGNHLNNSELNNLSQDLNNYDASNSEEQIEDRNSSAENFEEKIKNGEQINLNVFDNKKNKTTDFNNNISKDYDDPEELKDIKLQNISKNLYNKNTRLQNFNLAEQITAENTNILKIMKEIPTQNTLDKNLNNNLKINKANFKREDNKIVKIKRWVYDCFQKEFNTKIKSPLALKIEIDENIKIDIFCETNIILLKSKWKEIIPKISKLSIKEIETIYNESPEIKELLDMTFEDYLKNIIEKKWNEYALKEKENQVKNYKQRKYKKIIKYFISTKNSAALEKAKKYIHFEYKNKWGKNNINVDVEKLSILERFTGYYYIIKHESDFEEYINGLGEFKNESLALNDIEIKEIDDYITSLKEVAETLYNHFLRRRDAKRGRKGKVKG